MKQILILIGILMLGSIAHAQQSQDSIMITISLNHQEDKNLDPLQVIQKKNHFGELFPPKSARVVSWYVMMGVGQVVTVKIPAAALRTLNLSIEKGAWGAYNTAFYPTYDYLPVWEQTFKKQQQ